MGRGEPPADEDLIAHALDVLPDLELVRDRLGDDGGKRLSDAFGGGSVPGLDQTISLVADGGRRGLSKIQKEGTKAHLDDAERLGLEAVVSVYGRPALLIENGRFRPPEPPWEKLEEHRAAIETALRSVGRIEVTGHPIYDFVGTGFLVAPDIVMTNRHVAKEFLVGPPDWPFEKGMTARIDFNEEFLAGEPRDFRITEAIGISQDADLALLRIDATGTGGAQAPAPLTLSGADPAVGSDVYAIGYPVYDLREGVNAEALHRVFADIYGIKRLQPGRLTAIDAATHELVHDCSTLGGNSGSCLVDLQSGAVVGLHRRGVYLKGNFAVALAQVRADPVITQAALQFH